MLPLEWSVCRCASSYEPEVSATRSVSLYSSVQENQSIGIIPRQLFSSTLLLGCDYFQNRQNQAAPAGARKCALKSRRAEQATAPFVRRKRQASQAPGNIIRLYYRDAQNAFGVSYSRSTRALISLNTSRLQTGRNVYGRNRTRSHTTAAVFYFGICTWVVVVRRKTLRLDARDRYPFYFLSSSRVSGC